MAGDEQLLERRGWHRREQRNRSSSIRDGHHLASSGVRDDGRCVLLEGSDADLFHVLQCSTWRPGSLRAVPRPTGVRWDASWTDGMAAPATPVRRHGVRASCKHVTIVRVATNGRNQAEFHDVVLWGQLADFATSYLARGRLVYVEGPLQSRQRQSTDGTTRWTVEIVANRLQALSSKSASEAPAAA